MGAKGAAAVRAGDRWPMAAQLHLCRRTDKSREQASGRRHRQGENGGTNRSIEGRVSDGANKGPGARRDGKRKELPLSGVALKAKDPRETRCFASHPF